jgi:stalled ribosome rescue protein Dom34
MLCSAGTISVIWKGNLLCFSQRVHSLFQLTNSIIFTQEQVNTKGSFSLNVSIESILQIKENNWETDKLKRKFVLVSARSSAKSEAMA